MVQSANQPTSLPELYQTGIQELLQLAQAEPFDLKAFEQKSSQILEIAEEKELVDQQSLNVENYQVHLFLYFFTEDLANARFLWKRIPEKMKKEKKKQLEEVWEIGVSVAQWDFAKAFRLIQEGKGTEGQSDKIKKFTFVFKKVLHAQILRKIAKAFDSLSLQKAQEWSGVSDLKTELQSRGIRIQGSFIKLDEQPAESSEAFQMTEERMNKLVEVVKFLEETVPQDEIAAD